MADDNRTAAKNAAKTAAELKKQKKKKWCPIVAPDVFQNRILGEVLLEDASMLMNRHITVNMMQLMNDVKRQHISVMFKVTDIKEGKGMSIPVGYYVAQSSLKRLAKREKDKLSDSFVVKTQDGILVRIKPVMITNNMTKGAVLASLITSCRAICKEIINQLPFTTLLVDLVSGKFQREIKDRLHRVYPLRMLEIKTLEVETKKKKESVEEELLLRLKREQEAKDKDKADTKLNESAIKEIVQADDPQNVESLDEETTDDDAEEESEDDA